MNSDTDATVPQPIDLRMAFDDLLFRVGEIELGDDLVRATSAALGALRDLGTATDLATRLSGGAKSPQHLHILVETARITTALGRTSGDEARLREAVARCEGALALSAELGSPAPRLECQLLFLRGVALADLGDPASGVAQLEEVVAVMAPAVDHLEALRAAGAPAVCAMLDLTREDVLARRLLDEATASLVSMRTAARARPAKPWWRFWA